MKASILARYHRDILDGKDWQQSAVDIAGSNEELYKELAGAPDPDPGCECETCKNTKFEVGFWEDGK